MCVIIYLMFCTLYSIDYKLNGSTTFVYCQNIQFQQNWDISQICKTKKYPYNIIENSNW